MLLCKHYGTFLSNLISTPGNQARKWGRRLNSTVPLNTGGRRKHSNNHDRADSVLLCHHNQAGLSHSNFYSSDPFHLFHRNIYSSNPVHPYHRNLHSSDPVHPHHWNLHSADPVHPQHRNFDSSNPIYTHNRNLCPEYSIILPRYSVPVLCCCSSYADCCL